VITVTDILLLFELKNYLLQSFCAVFCATVEIEGFEPHGRHIISLSLYCLYVYYFKICYLFVKLNSWSETGNGGGIHITQNA